MMRMSSRVGFSILLFKWVKEPLWRKGVVWAAPCIYLFVLCCVVCLFVCSFPGFVASDPPWRPTMATHTCDSLLALIVIWRLLSNCEGGGNHSYYCVGSHDYDWDRPPQWMHNRLLNVRFWIFVYMPMCSGLRDLQWFVSPSSYIWYFSSHPPDGDKSDEFAVAGRIAGWVAWWRVSRVGRQGVSLATYREHTHKHTHKHAVNLIQKTPQTYRA